MGLFSVLSTRWSDDFGYLAWRQAIEVPSEAVDLTKPGAYTFQIGGTPSSVDTSKPAIDRHFKTGHYERSGRDRWRFT